MPHLSGSLSVESGDECGRNEVSFRQEAAKSRFFAANQRRSDRIFVDMKVSGKLALFFAQTKALMPQMMPAAPLPPFLLQNARSLPGGDDIVPLLPRHAFLAAGGLMTGDCSQTCLTVCKARLFWALDIFKGYDLSRGWVLRYFEMFAHQTHQVFYKGCFVLPHAMDCDAVLRQHPAIRLRYILPWLGQKPGSSRPGWF